MKRRMIFLATLVALIALGVPVHAQTGVKVRVPFDFIVADRTLPEGEYLISSLQDEVLVQNAQGKTVAVVLSNAVSGRSISKTGQAVFQCYEQRCFLSELWSPTQFAGRQLLKCHWEKELAKKETPKYFALRAKNYN